DEEAYDVVRGEELGSEGELVAVPGRRALVADPATLLRVDEVLVDPADGLLIRPGGREGGRVQRLEELEEGRPAGPEATGGGAPVEEDADLAAELVEEGFEVEAVALVGERAEAGGEEGEVVLEPAALLPLRDGLGNDAAGLQH